MTSYMFLKYYQRSRYHLALLLRFYVWFFEGEKKMFELAVLLHANKMDFCIKLPVTKAEFKLLFSGGSGRIDAGFFSSFYSPSMLI